MKLANYRGRAVLVEDGRLVDLEHASSGEFGPQIQTVLTRWAAFKEWAIQRTSDPSAPQGADGPSDETGFGPVVPMPRQVFAVGLNYRAHAAESGLPLPEVPLVFTKFPSSVTGPRGVLELPTDQVDWEVELAVVIGLPAHRVTHGEAWAHVAGITAAQDFSARDVQLAGGAVPQFSLGKSFPGFTPLGPFLVTPDELDDPDDIEVECRLNGETVQKSSTADLIFSVPAVISYLSYIVTLQPGDVILTGTPSGVGLGMNPPRYLMPGDEVTTVVAGVGELHQVCRAARQPFDPTTILG
jgi:2-keto-4-pentenoate hydratase/2-oxohepta-3-ene-1,7-dioic acid hydratase in catechol pathway